MNDENYKYDIIIIGGGPGGYVAAIRASQLGQNVALIEKEKLGGVCLNWGCIPTKALLRTSEIKNILDNSKEFGFTIENYKINFSDIIKRSRDVSKKLSSGVEYLMNKNKIKVFYGTGKIKKNGKDLKKVEVILNENNKNISLFAPKIILATGASSKNLPFVSSDGNLIWDYKSALIPKTLPNSIVIIGSGAIGVEFASFYADLGVKVTIVELLENILPNEDHEISDFVFKSFKSRGINIMTNAKLINVESKTNVKCKVNLNGKEIEVESEKMILAVGVNANINNLGLEEFDIKVSQNIIETNEWMETSEKGIYAIGDLTKGPWLAHKASHEAIICIEKINGLNPHPIATDEIPGCTYSRPQVASIGLTEKEAKKHGYSLKIGKFSFTGNGKAIALGDSDGFVKTIFNNKTGELIGAHLVGPEVTELVQGFAIAKKLESTEAELMSTIFPHPTLSEGMHESVLDAYNKVLHF